MSHIQIGLKDINKKNYELAHGSGANFLISEEVKASEDERAYEFPEVVE